MKLYDVVFAKDKTLFDNIADDDGNQKALRFVDASNDKNKYKSIYIEDTITGQRYFLHKDIVKDITNNRKNKKSNDAYPEYIRPSIVDSSIINNSCLTPVDPDMTCDGAFIEYDLSTTCHSVDVRNRNVVVSKYSDNANKSDVLSVAINTDDYILLDYESYSNIIQTGKRNSYQTCIIDIPEFTKEENSVLYLIGIILKEKNDDTIFRYNIMITDKGLSIYKFDLFFSEPSSYFNCMSEFEASDKFYRSFKLSTFEGLGTEVILIDKKYFKEKDGEVTVPVIDSKPIVGRDLIKVIIPCDENLLTDPDSLQILEENILKKNVRSITTLGVKLNRDFYKKYRILYMMSYSPKTGLSTCVKSN